MDKVTDREATNCASCNCSFIPTRSDAQYCSSSCRQKAYRQKKPKTTTELTLRSELTPKQELFVQEYAKEPNAKAAAIKAGYSPKAARQIGSRLLTRVDIKSAIQARGAAALARIEVTEDMVLQELAAIAFSNLEDFVTWDETAGSLVVKPSAEIPRHLAAAIESIEDQVLTTTNKDGSRTYSRHKQKVKLYNKLDALKVMAEYLGITDSMAPKVTVRLITGIDRTPEPIDVTPEPVTGN